MKKTIINPYKMNHRLYVFAIIISFLVLIVSFIIHGNYGELCDIFAEIIRNLSYGCIASAVVAWLIERTNTKNQNRKANEMYDAVYLDFRYQISTYISLWAELCKKAFDDSKYIDEKHTWTQWYNIFKEEYMKSELNKQLEALEYLSFYLKWSVQKVKKSVDTIENQRFVLRINDIINSDIENSIFHFQSTFTDLEMMVNKIDILVDFWVFLEIANSNIEKYIKDWVDIEHFNRLQFKPCEFWHDIDEFLKAVNLE